MCFISAILPKLVYSQYTCRFGEAVLWQDHSCFWRVYIIGISSTYMEFGLNCDIFMHLQSPYI